MPNMRPQHWPALDGAGALWNFAGMELKSLHHITPPTLPDHLAGDRALGLREGAVIAQYELGAHRNFIYLIVDWQAKAAAIVDPQSDLGPPLGALKAHGLRLERILLTHTHYDHIAGLGELARDYPGMAVHLGKEDEHRIAREIREKLNVVHAKDGDAIPIGKLSVKVLHTPGHSPGECSYLIAPFLFTGDTIFIRDCGRTDFEGGSNEQMFASLQRVKALPPETVILPGHHYQRECASTVGREQIESPPFRCGSVQELEALP